jgi:hypothetical protein
MGLKNIERLPAGAVHIAEFDTTMPSGTKIEQYRFSDSGRVRVFEKFTTKDGDARLYELGPDRS